jgi:cytochrome c oxidase cbb3-type subunit 4
MDIGDLRGISTIFCMVAFAAFVYWAYGPSRKGYFEEAGMLPFSSKESVEESSKESAEESAEESNGNSGQESIEGFVNESAEVIDKGSTVQPGGDFDKKRQREKVK